MCRVGLAGVHAALIRSYIVSIGKSFHPKDWQTISRHYIRIHIRRMDATRNRKFTKRLK